MASNFKEIVTNIYNQVAELKLQQSKLEIYKADKEYGSFFLQKEYPANDHTTFHADVNQILGLLPSHNKIEKEDTTTYEIRITEHVKLIITVTLFVFGATYDIGRIRFVFLGRPIEVETSFSDMPEVTTGSMFCSSWSEDLSEAKFYQVIRRSGNTIYTRRVHSSNDHVSLLLDTIVPIKNDFVDEQIFRSKVNPTTKITTIEGLRVRLWQ